MADQDRGTTSSGADDDVPGNTSGRASSSIGGSGTGSSGGANPGGDKGTTGGMDDQDSDALPASDGGTMHYGGTDAAYDGIQDRNEGDAADRAVATDRDDLRGPAGHTADAGAPSMLGRHEED